MEWIMVILMAVGLAMDAFSVSLANGFAEPNMKKGRMLKIAGVYALFQFIMPAIGWFLVHEALGFFAGFQKFTDVMRACEMPCIVRLAHGIRTTQGASQWQTRRKESGIHR